MKTSSILLAGSLLSSTAVAFRGGRSLFKRAYTPPPGSPGFYHGNSTAAVTFDNLSAFVGNQRVFIFSGEFHPWRLPSGIGAWRDVLQKMKAAGYNAVSVYLHWGLTEGKQGSLDFDYYRSHTDFYKVASEVGIHVIVRPGPYINAETLGGGLPPWLTNNPVEARTNATAYLNAWTPYIAATAKFAAPFQYPDGPIIAVQVENEFFPDTDPIRSGHMVQIENVLRSNGITKVPLTHNDNGIGGEWAHGVGMVDLYTWDSYPNGFNCANPTSWSEVNSADNQVKQHQSIDPDVVWATSEFQGGSFDPWGGSGYDKCYQLLNDQFANVYYKNNVAGSVRWMSFYMTYGGTNWGNLAEPTVYTSYDYGAPIREDRTLSTKFNEIKLQTHFLHASSDLYTSSVVFAGTGHTDNSNIYTTFLEGQGGTGFYVFRQTTNKNTNVQTFTAPVNVSNSVVNIPQFGSKITLAGRESKILVTNYRFGKSILQYATAEIMTWTTIDGKDIIVLYALSGQNIEAVFTTSSNASPTVSSSTISAKTVNGTVQVTGSLSPSSISTIAFGSTVVIIADKETATTFWNPHLISQNSPYDVSPSSPSVLVLGPYLVRNATIAGSTLNLLGDINSTTPITILAPEAVTKLTWNGENIGLTDEKVGMKSGTLNFNLSPPSLPDLKSASWSCIDSLPEIQDGFSDASWTNATKTSTQRPLKPFAGQYVVYADEYGFHQGNTLYRGHFTGNATSIWLSVQGGFNFGYSVWINGLFLGSSVGTNQYTTSMDLTNTTWTFPSGSVRSGDNVITIVFDQTGIEEDYNGTDSYKTPRGIRGYILNGGTISSWKLIGNFGGESYPDKVRGPFNEGGLYVERIGAHLPGFQTTGWQTGSTCNPTTGITKAGITAYRTTFNLNLPPGSDIPLALKLSLDPSSSYRTVIYINGWQFGRFSSKDGPQDTFTLPDGILNPHGQNTLLVTLWSLDSNGSKMGDIKLVNTALVMSSKEGGLVVSPTFQQVRN